MEENNQEVSNQHYVQKNQNIPNSIGVLVLGIASIVTCCCYGVIGIICGIIALVLYKGAMDQYNQEPELYSVASLKNLKAGRICAIIGVVLGGIYFVLCLVSIILNGAATFSQMPWDQMNY